MGYFRITEWFKGAAIGGSPLESMDTSGVSDCCFLKFLAPNLKTRYRNLVSLGVDRIKAALHLLSVCMGVDIIGLSQNLLQFCSRALINAQLSCKPCVLVSLKDLWIRFHHPAKVNRASAGRCIATMIMTGWIR